VATRIEFIGAMQVLDSRGNPTVQAAVRTKLGTTKAITPSGASTGKFEALELRDGGKDYGGKSVGKAVANVNGPIAKRLVGMDAEQQQELDNTMVALDGTAGKTVLGANATTAVSMAVARAGALAQGKELFEYIAGIYKPRNPGLLPVPMLNVINGGKHASGGLACQEVMIQPSGAGNYSAALQESAETYHELKKTIASKFGGTYANLGDEGGFVPPVKSMGEAFSLCTAAAARLGCERDFTLAIDPAASNFYENGKYAVDGKALSSAELATYYAELETAHPLRSIEDGFQEEGFDEFAAFTRTNKYQVVGDDLLVTNPTRIKKAIEMNACNALLLKINQIGTVTEAMQAARLAQDAGWNVVVSNRSGEGEDSFIADLAVGIGAGQIKTGAPARGERTCKYNRLLEIEAALGSRAVYRNPFEK
jgi:enolase